MKYMGICGTAFKNGSNVPEDSQENKVFAHDVSFNEATSESVQQMSLNCIILREYGVPIEYFSKISQIGSLILSATSVILAFTKVTLTICLILWYFGKINKFSCLLATFICLQ